MPLSLSCPSLTTSSINSQIHCSVLITTSNPLITVIYTHQHLSLSLSLKMLSSFFALDKLSCPKLLKPSKKPIADAKTIYRDELDNKGSRKKAGKTRDHFAYSKVPLLANEDGKDFERGSCGNSTAVDKKEVIRVKVRMTKQEAARMLSKCKDGGVLEFKDVAHELVQLPTTRISIVESPNTVPVLESIPEEI
jgi:hypothetical protein